MIEPEPTEQERKPSQAEVAAMIADELGETEESVRKKIVAIVYALGRRQSRQLLNHALQIEEHGGEMLPDGSRRRTVGGIFFNLAASQSEAGTFHCVPGQRNRLPRPRNPMESKPRPTRPTSQRRPLTNQLHRQSPRFCGMREQQPSKKHKPRKDRSVP